MKTFRLVSINNKQWTKQNNANNKNKSAYISVNPPHCMLFINCEWQKVYIVCASSPFLELELIILFGCLLLPFPPHIFFHFNWSFFSLLYFFSLSSFHCLCTVEWLLRWRHAHTPSICYHFIYHFVVHWITF